GGYIAPQDDLDDYDDDYTSITRQCGVTFVINGYGYVATGDKSSLVTSTWEYSPATDLWTKKTEFEGTARTNAVGFTINNRGFVLTGKTSSLYLDDVWEFYPFAEQVDND
ncbi:MAG TPA: galactose oxidase, partial [Tenuifilaceae bacterium]|nr:galactose oxidase [Tenuifilaceae bacterium]